MPPDYAQQPNPNLPPGPAPTGQQPATFDFILNPNKPAKPPNILAQSSALIRILVVAGGFLVFLILFIIVKGILFKGPDFSGYVSIAQDQQSVINLITNASGANQLSGLPTNDQNLAATAELVLTSNQSQVITYLKQNGHSLSSSVLSQTVDGSITSELSNAESAGDYSTVFQNLLTNQLNTYINDINKAMPSSGVRGKALLKTLYAQAQLMVSQLS